MMSLPVGRLPVIPLMGVPGIALTNTTLKENLTDPEIQYTTLNALLERFQPDGIFVFMDLTVEAECLGLPLLFPEHEAPSVANHPLQDAAVLESLKRNWHGTSGRMPVFLRTLELMSRTSTIMIGGYAIGPLSLAGELMGVSELAIASKLNKNLVEETLEFTTGVVTAYARAILNSGADILALLEPTSVIFSPEQFEDLCAKHFMEIQDALGTRCILHVCGNTTPLMKQMVKTHAFGLSLDSMVDFGTVSNMIPSDMLLIGNISPVKTFLQGTRDDMEHDVGNLLNAMRGKANFVLSSGCDLPAGVPLENIATFVELGRKHSWQPSGQ
jgi:uroporphyrinogen decarboxylase